MAATVGTSNVSLDFFLFKIGVSFESYPLSFMQFIEVVNRLVALCERRVRDDPCSDKLDEVRTVVTRLNTELQASKAHEAAFEKKIK